MWRPWRMTDWMNGVSMAKIASVALKGEDMWSFLSIRVGESASLAFDSAPLPP
jgi:hypothetical protein